MESLKENSEANAFAMELLMPSKMMGAEYQRVRAETDDLGVIVQRLASRFQVEPSAMHARLLMLGYILG